jgi:hypothetical protein
MGELDEQFRSYCRAAQMSYHPEVADTPWHLEVEGDPTSPVIIGETVQNIRTALDYLIYALVLHSRGRKPRSMTQFPIADTAGDFFRARYQIAELPGELRRRVRKLQPYQSKSQRSDTLTLIRRLSNADKHRLLIVVDTNLTGAQLRRGFEPTAGSIGVIVPGYLAGTNYEKHVTGADQNIVALMYFTLSLGDAEDADAFDTLKRCLWTATEIIDSFEPEFGA